MLLKDAISKRIIELCDEKNLSINKLSKLSYITQSTLQNIVSCNNETPNVMTIMRICNGLGISACEFFNDEVFNDIFLDI